MVKNVMRSAQLAALFVVAGLTSTTPALAQDYDADGCTPMALHCWSMSGDFDEDSDTAHIMTVDNRCGVRVTARLCQEVVSDSGTRWNCHNYALANRQSQSQTTFFASGRYKADLTGSRSAASDSTCRAKAGIGRE